MLPKNKLTPFLSAWIEILKAKTNATMVTKPNERKMVRLEIHTTRLCLLLPTHVKHGTQSDEASSSVK
jgi:hypothetical protein